ncbi:hypothetical protein V6N13_018819 [Hibiscus sabdariffa]
MDQPQGFEKCDEQENLLVYRLKKSLYGLKQAPRAWFEKFRSCLTRSLGCTASLADSSLYFWEKEGCKVYVMVYVDDVVVTGDDDVSIDKVVQEIIVIFSLKDLGDLSFFLGMNVRRVKQGIILSQRKHILEVLETAKMLDANPAPTPMVTSPVLTSEDGDPCSNPTLYRQIVGILQHVCNTRPDIHFAVNKVSQFMQQPTEKHWKVVQRILKYLKGMIDHGLFFDFTVSPTTLVGYSDSYWGSKSEDWRSTSGHCLFLVGI